MKLHGPTVDVVGWGDWIVTSNDWLYDTNLGGWWKLNPSFSHAFYGVSYDGNNLYAAAVEPTAEVAIERYNRTVPSTSYNWLSYPIRLPQGSKDHNYSVQEVVVRAQGQGTVQITVTGIPGSTFAASPSDTLTFTTTDQPSMQIMRSGIVAQDVTIEITSTGDPISGSPAPIVYSVALGYSEQNPVSSG